METLATRHVTKLMYKVIIASFLLFGIFVWAHHTDEIYILSVIVFSFGDVSNIFPNITCTYMMIILHIM